jgi:hypothetical protein
MNDFLLIGTLFGLALSFFHAVYMYGLVVSGANTTASGPKLSALNFSLWTCALWLLLGAYLLGFWLISVIFYIVFKAFR